MNNRANGDILQRAARRADHRPFFVASALAAYRALYQIGEDELATFLDCVPAALPKLALCRRPHATAPNFRAEVERIASYAGANSIRLAQLLREVESTTALRHAQSPQDIVPNPGILLAARDRTAGEPGDDTKGSET